MPAKTYPIELESRTIHCRTEPERTMLREAHNICCDTRSSKSHSPERLREISGTCREYGLGKIGEVVAALAEQSRHRAA
jgi:hypothetical protein